MKFCKNLQRVVDISDPEWAPYWTNYKMLKKLIKELPSLVPSDYHSTKGQQRARAASQEGSRAESPASMDCSEASVWSTPAMRQQHGDKTTEETQRIGSTDGAESSMAPPMDVARAPQHEEEEEVSQVDSTEASKKSQGKIGKSPGEVAFFKLLHAELKKAEHFFEKAQQEFVIREERVREGMDIIRRPNSIMVSDKWSLLAKSLYRLYKDLLLLETFAIMTYCAFSKILKKHDKVTGYNTRSAFMANVVNKSNFTNYPVVLQMIDRSERAYEEVSENLLREGRQDLYEDERLFINMIHRLNEQVLDTAEGEGALDRKESRRSAVGSIGGSVLTATGIESRTTSSLRSLVEENDAKAAAAHVSEGQTCDDEVGRKRKAESHVVPGDDGKRQAR